ncbi:MAG: hypothetical protein IJP27_09660, partial [Clostridia bacterium]|nr:hypothetical protein [Clostridia bacterium]
MIGLFGSVLVCRDDSAYYAMDLERGKKWVELSAVGEHTAFAADSTVLYLYGKTEEGAYCDTLSLAELKVQRAAEQYPVWDATVIDGVLYRILETPQGLQLYRGNALFSEQAGAYMEEESGVLFFRGATPRYVGAVNLSNGEYRTIDSLFVTFGNGIYGQGSSEQNAKYFDIATGKEIIPTEEQLNRRPLENGHYIYEKTVCCITLDGKEYRVDLSGYGSATPKVSEYGVAFRYDASLVTVDWEGQILRHYLDYEL